MNNYNPLKLSVRLLGAWLIFSLIGILVGSQLLVFLLPIFSDIINVISSDYSHILKISYVKDEAVIEITAKVIHAINATSTLALSPGKLITSSINVMHLLVPVVILFSLLVAWPVNRIQQRKQILLLAIPMTFIILMFVTPALLASQIEMNLISLIQKVGGTPKEPFVIKWMIFIEMGGLWLFPVVAAVVCVKMSTGIDNIRLLFNSIGENSNQTKK